MENPVQIFLESVVGDNFQDFLLKPWLCENIDTLKYMDIMENPVQNGFPLYGMSCRRM